MLPKINQILIMDNGAHTIKIGFSTDSVPKIIPNCITKVKSERRRPFIGDQLEECKDYSGMFYILPFSKGYLLNWDVQRQVWDYIFRTKLKLPQDSKHRFSEIGLLITEPVYNFSPLREILIEMLFEEYGFGMILISSSSQLASFKYLHEENIKNSNNHEQKRLKKENEIACLVVDSGFSFTHVVPFVEGYKISTHMKRIDVGGKALTNHLKDIISYRQLNVLDETYVVNQMKEDCCFVSTSFWKDLEAARQKPQFNNIFRDYVLPDYTVFKRGFIYDKEKHAELITPDHQRIRMNNERFQVPEILFNPGDVNIDQIGISNTIIHCVSEFNPNYKILSNSNSVETANVSMNRERPENLKDLDSDEDTDEDSNDDYNSKSSDIKQNGNSSKEKEQDSSVNLDQFNDENIQAHLYNNIILIGGNCCFANFRERVYNDIRSNVADLLNIRVKVPEDPMTYGWQGGRNLCQVDENGNLTTDQNQSLFFKYAVTRKQYQDFGASYCMKKLSNYKLPTFS